MKVAYKYADTVQEYTDLFVSVRAADRAQSRGSNPQGAEPVGKTMRLYDAKCACIDAFAWEMTHWPQPNPHAKGEDLRKEQDRADMLEVLIYDALRNILLEKVRQRKETNARKPGATKDPQGDTTKTMGDMIFKAESLLKQARHLTITRSWADLRDYADGVWALRQRPDPPFESQNRMESVRRRLWEHLEGAMDYHRQYSPLLGRIPRAPNGVPDPFFDTQRWVDYKNHVAEQSGRAKPYVLQRGTQPREEQQRKQAEVHRSRERDRYRDHSRKKRGRSKSAEKFPYEDVRRKDAQRRRSSKSPQKFVPAGGESDPEIVGTVEYQRGDRDGRATRRRKDTEPSDEAHPSGSYTQLKDGGRRRGEETPRRSTTPAPTFGYLNPDDLDAVQRVSQFIPPLRNTDDMPEEQVKRLQTLADTARVFLREDPAAAPTLRRPQNEEMPALEGATTEEEDEEEPEDTRRPRTQTRDLSPQDARNPARCTEAPCLVLPTGKSMAVPACWTEEHVRNAQFVLDSCPELFAVQMSTEPPREPTVRLAREGARPLQYLDKPFDPSVDEPDPTLDVFAWLEHRLWQHRAGREATDQVIPVPAWAASLKPVCPDNYEALACELLASWEAVPAQARYGCLQPVIPLPPDELQVHTAMPDSVATFYDRGDRMQTIARAYARRLQEIASCRWPVQSSTAPPRQPLAAMAAAFISRVKPYYNIVVDLVCAPHLAATPRRQPLAFPAECAFAWTPDLLAVHFTGQETTRTAIQHVTLRLPYRVEVPLPYMAAPGGLQTMAIHGMMLIRDQRKSMTPKWVPCETGDATLVAMHLPPPPEPGLGDAAAATPAPPQPTTTAHSPQTAFADASRAICKQMQDAGLLSTASEPERMPSRVVPRPGSPDENPVGGEDEDVIIEEEYEVPDGANTQEKTTTSKDEDVAMMSQGASPVAAGPTPAVPMEGQGGRSDGERPMEPDDGYTALDDVQAQPPPLPGSLPPLVIPGMPIGTPVTRPVTASTGQFADYEQEDEPEYNPDWDTDDDDLDRPAEQWKDPHNPIP